MNLAANRSSGPKGRNIPCRGRKAPVDIDTGHRSPSGATQRRPNSLSVDPAGLIRWPSRNRGFTAPARDVPTLWAEEPLKSTPTPQPLGS